MSRSEASARDAAGIGGEGYRLHPMTLFHRALVSIPALVLILFPVFRSGDTTAWLNLVIGAVYAALVLPWMIVHYLRFRYWITENEIVIHSGVLTRRRRNIPIDRIQTVDIERQLLHRLTGTSRVRIHTAGSTRAEGSLDVVSAQEAARIREAVRALQAGEVPTIMSGDPTEVRTEHTAEVDADFGSGSDEGGESGPLSLGAPGDNGTSVFELGAGRVLLSGVFRFSLLYLALAFSALQYIDPNPEVLLSLLENISGVDAVRESPWTAGLAATLGAILLGWASGIVMNVNKYWGFRLESAEGRLYRRHGLLSIREGTIPLRKVQALVIRTNPIMRHFGWYAMDAQTMGIDVGEAGHAIVVPFARLSDIERVATLIVAGMAVRDRAEVRVPTAYSPVSRLTIRRALVRYLGALAVIAVGVSQFWSWGWWILALAPIAVAWAFLRYSNMGYTSSDTRLWVRSGVFRHFQWLVPLSRLQVIHQRASFFQRRLKLATVYTDTAGASPLRSADIVDLPGVEANRLAASVYDAFGRLAS